MLKIFSISIFAFLLITTNTVASTIELPVYGNWCGPGHPVQGTNPRPTDLIDESCRIHDHKYSFCETAANRLICEAQADLEMVSMLRNNLHRLNKNQLAIAIQIAKYFTVQAPTKVTTAQTKVLINDVFTMAKMLENGANNSLLDIGIKLIDIHDNVMLIKDLATDVINRVVIDKTQAEEK